MTGTRIGDYELHEVVRASPWGPVHRATQRPLDRPVTLVVSAEPPGTERAERFLARARAAAAVDHPAVLSVHEVGVADGVAFAALPDVGRPLAEVRRPLSHGEVIEFATRVAACVEATRASFGLLVPGTPQSILVGEDGAVWLSPLDAPDGTGWEAGLSEVLAAISPAASDVGERTREGAFASPSAAVAELRAALAPGGRRGRMALAAVGLVAATAAGVAVTLTGGADSPNAPAVAGSVVARVPLGGTPFSITYGEGALWVATTERQVVRVDPRTDRVAGAPVRFSDTEGESNLTIRTGSGAVFAIDGRAGLVVRLDARTGRITRRTRVDGRIEGAVVDRNRLWVTVTTAPSVRPRRDRLVALDATTLRQRRERARIGLEPYDVEIHRRVIYVLARGGGTVIRYDPRTGTTERRAVGIIPLNGAIAGGRLWAPSAPDHAVYRLGLDGAPDAPPVRLPFPTSAVALGPDVWVATNDSPFPGATSRLQRVDARSGRVLGASLDLRGSSQWPTAGDGTVWVANAARREVVRIRPSTRRPPARPVERRLLRESPLVGRLVPGPQRLAIAGVPVSFTVADDGWFAATTGPPAETMQVRRTDDPEQRVGILFVTQVVQGGGGTVRARTADGVLRALRSLRGLRFSRVRRMSRGWAADVRVNRVGQYPFFCGRPCVPALLAGPVTFAIERPLTRLAIVDTGARVAVITNEGPDRPRRLGDAVMASLRLGG